ncbi:RecF/RecN/SMC [Pavlovales sp. CCMP2436]|nr:RecF/RecN/SMC [Pavlovales sp. CCMP2436]
MPRWLESLTVAGFKSYAVEQTLLFERGLQVIHGPNGCGKSNVIDALLFVLGEGPARLRVARLSDLRTSAGAAGARACAVSATIRVVAEGGAGRYVLSAELKADSCVRKLDGCIITTKALREWLQRANLVAEGALYYIRQAAVAYAVQSEALFPLIAQASGCSSYLAARADATARLCGEELKLGKVNEDIGFLQAGLDKNEAEHAAVEQRERARTEGGHVEHLLGLSVEKRREALLLERAAEARTLEVQVSGADARLAAVDAEQAALCEELAALVDEDASNLQMQRGMIASALGELIERWASVGGRVAQAEPQAAADEMRAEGERLRTLHRERLRTLHRELTAKLTAKRSEAASARDETRTAHAALLDARRAVLTLEDTRRSRQHALPPGGVSVPLDQIESQRALCRGRLMRLRSALDQHARAIAERTQAPAFCAKLLPRRPVRTVASLIALKSSTVDCSWCAALDGLLAPSLHVIVVETSADASMLIKGSASASPVGVRVWPLDRIQKSSTLELARAQETVIERSKLEAGAAVRPSALLACEPTHEQAVAFAVGRTLLVRDGEAARRVLGAAKESLAWCVDECIAMDGTRHRLATVRGGYDRRSTVGLVATLAERARTDGEVRALEAELRALDGVAACTEAASAYAEAQAAIESTLGAANACLAAATQCARIREESALLCDEEADACALESEVASLAQLIWPASPTLLQPLQRELDARQACKLAIAHGCTSLNARCDARCAAVDEQLALAENADLSEHSRAEACAQLCERYEWVATKCSQRAEASALRLAQLDERSVGLLADHERARTSTAQARCSTAGVQQAIKQFETSKGIHAEMLASATSDLAGLRKELTSLRAASTTTADERAAAWGELKPSLGELGMMLGRCASLRVIDEQLAKAAARLMRSMTDSKAGSDDNDDDDAATQSQAWSAVVTDLRSLQARLRIALRGLEAGHFLDEARVLSDAASLPQRREDLAGFEEKRRTITESISVLKDGLAETDSRTRKAIDESLDAICASFSATFAELVPSKEATILAVEGGASAQDVARKLCVAVRERRAAGAGDGGWSEDLRELSGGQRTLLSIALLVSCFFHRAGDLLIIDEVDAALDDKNVEIIAHLLSKVASKTQVIAISHRAELQRVATRQIAISAGLQPPNGKAAISAPNPVA